MRLRTALCGSLLSGLVLFAANAGAAKDQDNPDRDSLDWLRVAEFAARQTDYSGIFVYQYDNHVETSRITHIVEPDSEYERLESLDGPKREIISHHGQIWCYINQKMEQVDSQLSHRRYQSLQPEQLAVLSENYQVKEAGIERVAEYRAQVIHFQPRDNLRYAHKIWIHTDSGLLLKAAVLGGRNRMVEQYAFTQLKIGSGVDRSWIKTIPSSEKVSSDVARKGSPGSVKGVVLKGAAAGLHAASIPAEAPMGSMPVNSGWVVDALPAGYKKTMEIQRRMRARHAPVTQLVFSDGLSAISVFIEPSDDDEDDVEGLSSRGAVNVYHKVVDGNLYTVVGEVPPRTVMQVLDSIRYSGR